MNELNSPLRTARSYERDFHAWTIEQASELRRSKPERLDWENLADKVESLGMQQARREQTP